MASDGQGPSLVAPADGLALPSSRTGSQSSRRSKKQKQAARAARAAGGDAGEADSSSETHATSTLATTKAKETASKTSSKKRGLFAAFFGALRACLNPSDALNDDIQPKPPANGTTTASQHKNQRELKPHEQAPTDAHDEKKLPPPAQEQSTHDHTLEASGSTTLAHTAEDVAAKPLPPPPVLAAPELAAPVPVKPFVAPARDEEVQTIGTIPAWSSADDGAPAGITSAAVMPPGATQHDLDQHHDQDDGVESSEFTDEDEHEIEDAPLNEDDDVDRIIQAGGLGIPIGPDGKPQPLLPPLYPEHTGRKCLVLDLDETLVHSSFKPLANPDYVIPFEYEMQLHSVYVVKRPGVDAFLKAMGEIYEVVIFTASVSKYADAVLDKLDVSRVVTHRLFRESCVMHRGIYVKDLSRLGRPIQEVIILDNSPASYIFHPNNAVPVSSWFSDPHDTELFDLAPFLDDLRQVDDVRGVLDGGR